MQSHPLHSPELLGIIFSYVDQRVNSSCAIVCRRWLEPALNELWRHVENPMVIFKLLAPMHITNTAQDEIPRWLFSRFVLPSDWSRFEYYAHRIRSLDYLEDTKVHWIDPSVYAEVARTRPMLVILPKLRRLVWRTKLLNEAILFMSNSVIHLEADIEAPFVAGEGFLETRAFLLEAAARLPNLTRLDIKASFSVVHVQEALLHLLGSSLKLVTLILPRYWLSSAVVSKLAKLPCLEVAQWEYIGQGAGDRKDVEDFRLSAKNEAFAALVDLSLEVDLRAAAELIENPVFPDRLTSFFVDSLNVSPPSNIQRFLASCSTKFRSLTLLHLDMQSSRADTTELLQITMETLQPVLACPSLVHFTFLHDKPLAVTDSDIKSMASKWPSVVNLYLNHEPSVLMTPPMTLCALLHFAEHCPRLEQLGLYIDATAAIPSNSNSRPFVRLETLHVGTSPISDVDEVALFLTRICSDSPIEISVNVGWDTDLVDRLETEVWRVISARHSVWQRVRTCLPMLVTMRAEERFRSRQLEHELERLRSRNQLLEANVPETETSSKGHKSPS